MKKIIHILIISCSLTIHQIVFSQGQWVWMHGSSFKSANIGGGAVNGTQGVPSAANTPGGSYESAEWTDKNGDFWILQYDGSFWKFNPPTNMWTWIRTNLAPVYGVQGVPAVANFPGSHGYGAVTWTDNNGLLWLFGGSVSGTIVDDVWKYDPIVGSPTYGQWTCMRGGAATGNWGTMGVSSPSNTPGPRQESPASWVDSNGDLWSFGGGPTSFGQLNDLWKYEVSTNQWIWMKGGNVVNDPAVYGTKGVANASNVPGARNCYSSWKDDLGNFWLYGGVNMGTNSNYSDLWKYDPVTGEWTWMNGSNFVDPNPVYGTICEPSAAIHPGSGGESRVRWRDDCGNFWIYGAGHIFTFFNRMDDLWKYDVQSGLWTCVRNSGIGYTPPVYGTKGALAPGNTPGWRYGSNPWRNKDGLWLYGGMASGTYDYQCDLWKFVPDSPQALFSFNTSSLSCASAVVSFTNSSSAGCNGMKSWLWNFGDPSSTSDNTSTLENPVHAFNSIGSYSVTLIATNCFSLNDTMSQLISIVANPVITILGNASICIGSSASLTADGGITYLWNNGATTANIILNPTATNTYTITVSDINGCNNTKTITVTVDSIPLPSISGPTSVCNGSEIILSANGSNTYIWSTGATGSTITINPSIMTTYSVIAFNGGCSNNAIHTVSVNASPAATVSGINAVCSGAAVVLSASGGTSYSWSTGSTISVITASPTSTTSYTLTAFTDAGCKKDTSFSITVNTLPIADAGLGGAICTGENISLIASGGSSYLWNTGETTSTINYQPTITTTYTVTISNGNCTNIDSVRVTVYTNPTANAGRDTIIESGQTIILTGTGGGSYLWSTGETTSTVSHQPAITTIYYLTVKDVNGCTSIDSLTVTVDVICKDIFIPTAFSPNEDGENDVFKIEGNCVKEMTFTIYNRWGEKIFETNDITKTWDGIHEGELMDTALFIYQFTATLVTEEVIAKKRKYKLDKIE